MQSGAPPAEVLPATIELRACMVPQVPPPPKPWATVSVAMLPETVTLLSWNVPLTTPPASAPPPTALFPENVQLTASNSAPSLAPAKTAPPSPFVDWLPEKVQLLARTTFSAKIAPPLPPLALSAWLLVNVLLVTSVPGAVPPP